MNFDCAWPNDSSGPLDLRNSAHLEHLLDDIRIAEELEIRHGDKLAGRNMTSVFGVIVRAGGHGPTSGSRTARSECVGSLFDRIAHEHALSLQDVLNARERLPARGANLPVTIPVFLFYVWLAWKGVHWIHRRIDRGEKWQTLLAVLYASLAVTGTVILLGGLWTGIVEIVRLGNEHLSYRALRVPWPWTHQYELFSMGVLAFWFAAAVMLVRRRSD